MPRGIYNRNTRRFEAVSQTLDTSSPPPDAVTVPVLESPEGLASEPALDFRKSAAFRDAVAAAARDAVREVLAESGASGATKVSDGGLQQLMEQLAMSFAQLSDQGTGRKRVAPEVLAKREAAFRRMEQRILHWRALIGTTLPGQAQPYRGPIYRVLTKLFLNDQIIDPFVRGIDRQDHPNRIIWTGIPNAGMTPLDESAQDIHDAWRESVGDLPLSARQTQPHWTTANGLVVMGSTAPPRRFVGGIETSIPVGVADNGDGLTDNLGPLMVQEGYQHALGVIGPNDPRAREISVLGSVAPKARQTGTGAEQPRA